MKPDIKQPPAAGGSLPRVVRRSVFERTLIQAAVLLENEARCVYRAHVSGRSWGYTADDIEAQRWYNDLRRCAKSLRRRASQPNNQAEP